MTCRCNRQGLPLHPRGEPGEMVPWTYLGGRTLATTVTQPTEDWLDGAPFRELLLYVDVKDFDGSPHLYIQTSCVEDESGFVTMVDHALTGHGRTFYKVASSDTVPLARFVRWRIAGASAQWRVMFRVLATLKRQR